MNEWLNQILASSSLVAWGALIVLIAFFINLVNLRRQNTLLQIEISKLRNEFRAMNSGHLGMGRKISKVVAEMANVENHHSEAPTDVASAKTYQQASLLLSRGASIDEVVESCEISPAEAELLAIVSHSAPSHRSQKTAEIIA